MQIYIKYISYKIKKRKPLFYSKKMINNYYYYYLFIKQFKFK